MGDDPQRGSLIALLSACNFTIGMGAFMLIGMLIPVSQDLGASVSTTGGVMTSYALAYAVLSPLLVALTGGIGRRRVLVLGLGLFALGNLVAALASDLMVLHLSRLFAAAGAGIFTPVAATVAAGLSAPDRQGRALASVFFGLTLAQVLGVPTGSYLAYSFGWRSAFFCVLALCIPCIWMIWIRVPAGLSFRPVSLRDLGRSLANFPMLLAVLFTTSFLGAIYVLYTYLAPLLNQTMGFGRDGVTISLMIFGVGAVIGNLLGGFLADRLGPFRTLLGLSLLQVLILPAFSFLPLPVPLVMALLLIWSICGWSFMASQQLRLIGLAGSGVPVVLAMNAAAIYIGAAVGSAIGAVVLERADVTALGSAAGMAALIAVGHICLSARLSASTASRV